MLLLLLQSMKRQGQETGALPSQQQRGVQQLWFSLSNNSDSFPKSLGPLPFSAGLASNMSFLTLTSSLILLFSGKARSTMGKVINMWPSSWKPRDKTSFCAGLENTKVLTLQTFFHSSLKFEDRSKVSLVSLFLLAPCMSSSSWGR